MEEFTSWTEVFLTSLQSFGQRFMGAIPGILGAILIFIVGWLFAKLFSRILIRLLKLIKFDALADRVNAQGLLSKANISLEPSKIVGRFVYWLLLLVVLITAADTLGWNAVSEEISKLIGYLPRLLVAIVIFIIGTYIAAFVRDIISGASGSLGIYTGRFISSFVYYLLFILVSLTALNQAGIDTSIISDNLLLILGAILLSLAVSFGIASRDVMTNSIAGYFGRDTYKEGMNIEVDGVQGVILSKSAIGLTLKSANDEKMIIPSSKLLTNNVRIVKDV